MSQHCSSVYCGVSCRIKCIRLGSDTYVESIKVVGCCGVHEVLVAQRVSKESVHCLGDHVRICVVVQRADSSGGHKKVLSLVHKSISGCRICGGLNEGDKRIIGLGPCSVLYLEVKSKVCGVNAVHCESSVVASAELYVVVTGICCPHVKEADRIVVVS